MVRQRFQKTIFCNYKTASLLHRLDFKTLQFVLRLSVSGKDVLASLPNGYWESLAVLSKFVFLGIKDKDERPCRPRCSLYIQAESRQKGTAIYLVHSSSRRLKT